MSVNNNDKDYKFNNTKTYYNSMFVSLFKRVIYDRTYNALYSLCAIVKFKP